MTVPGGGNEPEGDPLKGNHQLDGFSLLVIPLHIRISQTCKSLDAPRWPSKIHGRPRAGQAIPLRRLWYGETRKRLGRGSSEPAAKEEARGS